MRNVLQAITMLRRCFLQQSLMAPLLAGDWKSAPPSSFQTQIATWMKWASVPGVVAGALRNRRLSWIRAYGVQEARGSVPVTQATLFQAASLTKQLTAHAAWALHKQGKLDFDRPLVEYADDLPNPEARKVTARHVLSHSSGFPNWRFTEDRKKTVDLVPEFAPGTRYRYSGEGYFYLQRVLEQLTSQGYGRLIRNLVFEPCGMTASSVVWDPARLSQMAVPHDRRGEKRQGWDKSARALRAYAERRNQSVDDLRYEDYSAFTRESGDPVLPNWMLPNGAASLVTSAEDYARFLALALGNPELTKQQVVISDSLGWGPGWAIERAADRTYLWQWGDNGGYKNFVLAEPATGSALFVFTNGDAGARVYDRMVRDVTGHDHPALFFV